MSDDRRDNMDEAIDRVAAKMVAVADDAGALQTVIARLPERESRPWLLSVPVQATAAAALVVVAFLWARPTDRQVMPTEVSPMAATAPPLVEARVPAPAVERPDVRVPVRGSLIPDPRSPIPEDHERSLPAVAALPALELSSIATVALAPVALEPLAPLVLTDLPLAGDSSSPHEL